MIQVNPIKRPTLDEVLNDDWFTAESPTKIIRLDSNVVNSLSKYKKEEKFKNLILSVLVTHCNDEIIKDLMNIFKNIDKDKNGFIE